MILGMILLKKHYEENHKIKLGCIFDAGVSATVNVF